MGLSEGKLGNYIELRDVRNTKLVYGIERVRGVNTSKELMRTRADLTARDLSKFQIVEPGEFVFNHRTSRNGSKLSIAYNDTDTDVICTEDYVVFRISVYGRKYIVPEWLYLYFNRPEFDRYVITNSWGSSTEFFNWEDMCDINITLPPLSVQRKYVAIYQAMLENQKSYERGLEDLKKAVFSEIERVKHTAPRKMMGDLLEEVDVRNADGSITSVNGINIEKLFMPSVASTANVNLRNYKVVHKGQFAYSSMQTGRDECIRISLYDQEKPIIISPAYAVLETKTDEVVSEYIMLWFMRPETDRYGWFASDASIRSNLDLNRFYEIELPVPEMNIQKAIADIYAAYVTRRNLNEKLKFQIKSLCPILIKGSLEEGQREAAI